MIPCSVFLPLSKLSANSILAPSLPLSEALGYCAHFLQIIASNDLPHLLLVNVKENVSDFSYSLINLP